jgi:hypothetical protein
MVTLLFRRPTEGNCSSLLGGFGDEADRSQRLPTLGPLTYASGRPRAIRLTQARGAALFPTVSELIADFRVLRPGKGGGRERVDWAFARIEVRFGVVRIDQLTAREVEIWVAGLDTPSTRWEVSRVFRQLFTLATHHYQHQESSQGFSAAPPRGGQAVQRPGRARERRDRTC